MIEINRKLISELFDKALLNPRFRQNYDLRNPDDNGQRMLNALQNISLHIGNIFREGELIKEVVVKDFFTTTIHGAIPGKTQRRMCTISAPH